jgi:hypothetical protein
MNQGRELGPLVPYFSQFFIHFPLGTSPFVFLAIYILWVRLFFVIG